MSCSIAGGFLSRCNNALLRLAGHAKRPEAQGSDDLHQAPPLSQFTRLTSPEKLERKDVFVFWEQLVPRQ